MLVSAEKAHPMSPQKLSYLATKRKAEEFLLELCPNLNVTILRPGFIWDEIDKKWSYYFRMMVAYNYWMNKKIYSKIPYFGPKMDFVYPAYPV